MFELLKISRILIVGAAIGALLSMQSMAMHFEGGGVVIDMVPNSGSSVDLNPSGPTHLQDIKGYPFGSPFTDDSTIIETGLGVLVGTGAAVVVTELEEGAVILTIERVSDTPGSAIKVTWALNPEYTSPGDTVDIYYATGDGTGQYPTDFTQLVVQDNVVLSVSDVSDVGGNAFEWGNQVGGGEEELYFKGCINGAASAAGPTGLDGNLAVGKVNVPMTRKPSSISYNTFAVNLVPQTEDAFDSMFPAYSFVAVDPALNKLNADQIRGWDGANWIAYFKSETGQSWKLVTAPGEQATGKFANGYMIRLQPASAPGAEEEFFVSTVGKVVPAGIYQSDLGYGSLPVGLLAGPLKYTSFGNAYPKLTSFNDAFALNIAADELTKATTANKLLADQIRYWDAVSGNWLAGYLAGDNTWKLNTNDDPAFGLMIGTGYMFRKADASTKGAFIWKY